MNQANGRPSGNNKVAASETRTPIPWCDRRRTYCASGCSLRDKLSNSGACDWEARMTALPPNAYIDDERQSRDSDRQPGSSDPNRQPRPNVERQPRQQEQARQPGPRNQQHPRAKFENGRRKGPGQGQGGQRRPNDPNQVAAPGAAPAPEAAPASGAPGDAPAPAALQPDMFTAPVIKESVGPAPAPAPVAAPAPAPAVTVAAESPVSTATASND